MEAVTQKKKLKQVYDEIAAVPSKIKAAIMADIGWKQDNSFYAALRHPERLSVAHRKVFAHHLNCELDALDFGDAPVLVA